MNYEDIARILGDRAEALLNFRQPKINRDRLYLPSPDFVERVFDQSDRSDQVKTNLKKLFGAGRLAGTGYLSILPVDQGVEHAAGYSFAKNPDYFDPEKIVELAIEGGCNGVASSYGVLAAVSSKYADKIPLVVKLNHNQLLTYPGEHHQIAFASAQQASDLGAVAVGATIYFGSETADAELEVVRDLFEAAHQKGLVTILWCYVRNRAFRSAGGVNYETAVDLTGQTIYLGASLGADIVKQKAPTPEFGFRDLNFAKHSDEMYQNLLSHHPIDLTRYQVANGFMGRVGLINSGGGTGNDDLREAITTAVINKRAGGMGLILGRKAFSRPLSEGVELLHAVQDVYLEKRIDPA